MHLSRTSSAYDSIRFKLISGELKPGNRISELALSRELGISRSPVREALSRLATEGLVVSVPNMGAFVKTYSRDDLEHLYQLREWLESDAVAEAARRIQPAQLAELRERCREQMKVARVHHRVKLDRLPAVEHARWVLADLNFHLTLIRAAGNPLVHKIVADHHVLSQLFGSPLLRHTTPDLVRTVREHWLIYKAVRRRDAAAAYAAMVQHIRRGKEFALRALARMEEDGQAIAAAEDNWSAALRQVIRQSENTPASALIP
jgi:DNA-binding GntR family transcriptional regulator